MRRISRRITVHIQKSIETRNPQSDNALKEAVEQIEKRMVEEALKVFDGNRSLAAKRLGISRQGLLNKIHKFDLERCAY